MEVLAIHSAIFLIYSYGIYYEIYYNTGPPEIEAHHNAMGGKAKYLTCIDAVLQWAYFGFCIITDCVGTTTKGEKHPGSLHKFRDWIFTTLVFPMGIYVSMMFWGVYSVNREFIFPEFMDSWFPNWLNHVMHTLPTCGGLVEVFMVYHVCQNGIRRYVPMVLAYFAYLIWTLYIKYAGGIWVYPLYEVLGETERNIFFAFLTIPSLSCVVLGHKIHALIWRKNEDTKSGRLKEQ